MATCKILFFLLALYIWSGKCDVFYKRVGDEVSMKCGVGLNSNIDWEFNGELILGINGKTGTRRKGYSHITSKANAHGDSLRVPRLETRDTGVYSCKQSKKQYTVHVVSVFAKPGPVLVRSSDAELHCDITGNTNTEVQWLRPNGEGCKEKNQVIRLKSVTPKEAGQWTCQVRDDIILSVTLTVVDLQTRPVNVSEGDDIELPCSLPQNVSQRVEGGEWKADHLPTFSFPTLKNTKDKGLHWNGEDLSKVNFTTGQLSTNFAVTLKNVQSSDEGTFVCTVEFEGGASLSVKTTLRVVAKPSDAPALLKLKELKRCMDDAGASLSDASSSVSTEDISTYPPDEPSPSQDPGFFSYRLVSRTRWCLPVGLKLHLSKKENRMATCKILFFLLLALCIWCGKCDVLYEQVGGEVSMKCGVGPNSNIDWEFNGELILGINGKTGTRRKGYSHITSKANAHGDSLRVPRLETRDTGVYSCKQTRKQYTVHVVSVFAKPGPVLVQSSSNAELHCDITGNTNTEVQWLRPNGERYKEKNQVIRLTSVTSKEAGQWTCLVNDKLKLTITLTVVGLQTRPVNVSEGDDIELPCSLPQSVSQRVEGGEWKADHLSKVSFPTLKNTNDKGLYWNGEDLSKVNFTTGQLSTNFAVTLKNVQSSDKGTFVCTVRFEGGASLSVETTLKIVAKPSGGQEPTKGKGKTSAAIKTLTKEVYGLQLWVWIAVGASSVVLIGLIIVAVLFIKRNKQKKQRVRKLRYMRQSLTAKDYCKCKL
ncbi:hypothetical protein QQF64_009901 [Cirrhinus molitorella]|uniref:Ig-like domain-containing protein n=1 Tax=Cirrhinus molitorella TaxID=172907 RepID=A0ABR3M2G1_9TELE